MAIHAIKGFKRFFKSEDGVAVVEFVLSVPMMILIFAIVIEFGRLFLGYQATVSGVRDATRYLARIAPIEICKPGSGYSETYLSTYNGMLKYIIENDRLANSVLPTQFTITGVSATYVCVAGSFRTSPAPVATITANIDVQFPFGFFFTLFGSELKQLNTTVADSSRIFGS